MILGHILGRGNRIVELGRKESRMKVVKNRDVKTVSAAKPPAVNKPTLITTSDIWLHASSTSAVNGLLCL